ncbi:hypothetical protein EMIHUDRAFT_198201 [Emiliania huxleyi CCMP1516]|uniref:Peptidase M14 domain-containing protein n=2 Tax=Emiliania huxleyi TaxID=2903 RepID=A0A0D3IEF3_EMIH1|nr:hypothetical protein EMIHUDRAFT_198201 [Emiliania huxleyi CCMP1516]EOD09638.1 hypothetical protein EMIHUDRAFT_198201 [Emiliania huxleyi CCMP1516]|eukprot:XP_005762067.1 hypothetical protein EMIHUDRAFT_198201 [Emiliania huxleyi CCMP1516]
MDGPPSHGRAFAYYTYGAASSLLQSLARDYPQLASLTTAQEAYGLRSAGTCTDSAGHQGPCLNHIIQISNRSANAAVLSARPQIYISGALHGDEQVGIVTALELCRWLLTRYATDDWVRRLVDTRMVLISPMTNAVGSATRRRDELGIDPNRDFPFDQSAGSCMQTVTARTVNEIYRAHLLQLVAIGYNWGAYPYWRGVPSRSPDDAAMRDVAAVMSRYAGSGRVNRAPYRYSTMNEIVYPVHGGMEDWGYAASWDTSHVTPCAPKANGGYAAEKTHYGRDAIRAVTILVETSDQKMPPASTLGGEEGVYGAGGPADGHVPRNMRLALASIDLLQPHIELAPSLPARPGEGCLRLEWQVWGAIKVDDTVALWRATPTSAWEEVPFVAAPPSRRKLASAVGPSHFSLADGRVLGGDGVWATGHSPFSPPTIAGCARTPPHVGSAQLAVSVRADSSWAASPSGQFAPKLPPQTHFARARSEYKAKHGGFEVVGRSRWLSAPIALNCSAAFGCCALQNRRCSR